MIKLQQDEIERVWIRSKARVDRAGPRLHARFCTDVQKLTLEAVRDRIIRLAEKSRDEDKLTQQKKQAFNECIFEIEQELLDFQ